MADLCFDFEFNVTWSDCLLSGILFFQNPKQITQTNQPTIFQPKSKTSKGF